MASSDHKVWVEAGAQVGGHPNYGSNRKVESILLLDGGRREIVVTNGNGARLVGVGPADKSCFVVFRQEEEERMEKERVASVPAVAGQRESSDYGVVEPTVSSRPPEQREPQYPPADHLRGPE